MRTRAHGAEPASLDVPYLSTLFAYPEAEIQTLLDAPTAELIKDFLAALTTKGQEFDELKADKLRVDVELENSVRTVEGKLKAQKTTVTRQSKEIEQLRGQLNEAESQRERLATQLEQLQSSTSDSSAEGEALRQRIETLEASNRDALALVESKSTEKDRVAADLADQHGKLLSLRRDISQLEERNQSLDNAVSAHKFKEQSLQQEIELLKRNNEWHTTELQTRNQEYAKFRKERNARISGLQRELEDSTASVESLKRTETNLRQRLDELQGKADEAFARIASLQEELARKEQGWSTELEGSKRLAELQAQNAATHKARLHAVEGQMEQIRMDATEEISRLQAEIETERGDKEQAEAKVAELELAVEKLEQQPRQSRPATPMRNGPLDIATPGRSGMPISFSASARKIGRLLTNTEYVTKINELQSDLDAERRRNLKLSTTIDEMLNEAENRSPEILELRDEQQRLQEEVLNFSRLVEDSNVNRDSAIKESERWQVEANSKAREGDILRQQLRDLSAQIKILLVEMQLRDQGLEAMSSAERIQLEQAARGESEAWSENETMTNQFISQNLVIYRDVSQLQEQNQRLLEITRELGDRMEGEEARQKAAESQANAVEVEQLRQQVERYKDELQATATQIDSYIKERDMFRRMIQHKGHLASDADYEAMFGRSIPPQTPQRNGAEAVAQTPRSSEIDNMNKLLKEQQTFFDQYRNESAQDRKTLKDQVDALGRDKSTLQAEVAHWKSQKTLADERLQMLQANYAGLRSENSELQKRSQEMAENAAKQDLRTQQVAEELVEARSASESLRNEIANARAEKELWKRIESRLTDDNKGLMDERSRLNKLVGDLQSLQNERELSDSENRRRLQSRVEGLEAELGESKKKLEQTLDDNKRMSQRREYEEGQSRSRIDDLVKSLGNVREELAAAKTSRDSLQTRVDEMKIELRSAEERVAALQPRPTPRPQSQQDGEQQANGEDDLSNEQRLALELSDARRDLELAKNELESAKEQAEQYRSISQAMEEELANFNETSEQYKEEVDRQVVEKDARISELQQRIDDLLAELTTTNNELSELRTKDENASRTLNEQKSSFESEIARLGDDAERHAEEKRLYQADLKAQAEIAQRAQQSYEDELLKHAEAAKGLQAVRKEHNDLRTEVAGIRAEADAAKARLERGEESWSEQRDRFEQELEEAKNRRRDVDEQNRLLHEQMDSFSSELAALRAGRSIPSGQGESQLTTSSEDSNMQEVVKYLRREKEIVDVQYELSVQEAKRLQQQLDYASEQLENTRHTLAEERRQSSEQSASESSTTKLMQTINELNLFRESSTTLRNEARQAREKLEEKSKEVERLLSELDPLKSRVGELEADVEVKDGEIKLLQDDRDHWRERTQNIISKYDRVDPAVIEEMKAQIEQLKTDKEQLETEQGPLREQINGIDQTVETAVKEKSEMYEQKLEKFRTQAKEQNRKQVAKIKEGETALETASAEKASVEEQLDAVKKELEETRNALTEAQAAAPSEPKESGANEQDNMDQPPAEDSAALQARLAQAEKSANDESNRAQTLSGEVQTLQARVQELEVNASTLQQRLDSALQQEEGEISNAGIADTSALDNLRQELTAAQQEVETLRANAVNHHAENDTSGAAPAQEETNVAGLVAKEVAQLRKQMEEQHELAKKQLEEDRDRRIESMKNSLRQKLKEERDKIREAAREELLAEHSAEIEKLKAQHDAAITKLKEEHQQEIQRLTKEGGAAVAKAEEPTSATKAEPATDSEWPTEDQMLSMMKTSQRIKGIFNANINKRVATETEKAHQTIAEKEEEIAKLKAQPTSGTNDAQLAELQSKLAAAEAEKKAAVQKAVDQEGMKSKVQISQRNIAQAKLAVVRKAAQETPDKPVKEVWEVADKAKPAPPAAPPAAAAASSTVASPAAAAQQPAVPPSTTQPLPSSPSQPADGQDTTEEEKLKRRQERFGTTPSASSTTHPPSGTFGQPSQVPSGIRAPSGTFGQPSQMVQPGSLARPARRPSNAGPNPLASVFQPNTDAASGQQIPRRASQQTLGRGGLAQPRGGGAAGSNPGAAGDGGPNANAAAQGASTIPRGSGIPRSNMPRGGRGGTIRGGAANAGQKRQHEGDDDGASKRTRGGGPGGA